MKNFCILLCLVIAFKPASLQRNYLIPSSGSDFDNQKANYISYTKSQTDSNSIEITDEPNTYGDIGSSCTLNFDCYVWSHSYCKNNICQCQESFPRQNEFTKSCERGREWDICKTSFGCAEELICMNDYCRPLNAGLEGDSCISTNDCQGAFDCRHNRCQYLVGTTALPKPDGEIGSWCNSNRDCMWSYSYCKNGKCDCNTYYPRKNYVTKSCDPPLERDLCKGNENCGFNMVCQDGYCRKYVGEGQSCTNSICYGNDLECIHGICKLSDQGKKTSNSNPALWISLVIAAAVLFVVMIVIIKLIIQRRRRKRLENALRFLAVASVISNEMQSRAIIRNANIELQNQEEEPPPTYEEAIAGRNHR